jgi:chemotaxis protein MotA
MAVAIITTFYGAVLANMVFLPISGKLRNRSQEEVMVKEIMLNGILAIARGDNPRVIEQKLHSFLPPPLRQSVFQ